MKKLTFSFTAYCFQRSIMIFFSDSSGYRLGLKLPSVRAPDIFLSHARARLALFQVCVPQSGPPFGLSRI